MIPGEGGAVQNSTGVEPRSIFDHVVIGVNAIGSLWVLLLVVLMNLDAIGRSFLGLPIAGVVEVVALSMALIVFCQLADTVRLGKLTRSDGYIGTWLSSGAVAGRIAVAAIEILGAVFMALIVIGTFPLMSKAYQTGDYIGTRGVFSFPEWPIKAIVIAGALIAAAAFVIRAARILAGKNPDKR